MASTIVFRRGNTFPSQGSGITLAEPVFNTSQNTFHIGLGHGVTAAWVGAPITGLSASIASGEAYKIPTAEAVKNYIGGLCYGNTGAPTITQYVSSFNGLTGAVGGVCAAQANTFTALQSFANGISASGITVNGDMSVTGNFTVSGGVTFTTSETVLIEDNIITLNSNVTGSPSENAGVEIERGTSANVQLLWNESSDKWTFTNDGSTYYDLPTSVVTSFNGTTGAVQGVSAAVAGTGISVSGATGAVTITNTGVESFNGTTGAVGGVTTSVANTFTALQTFTTGISASGATFGSVYVSGGVTVGLLTVRTPATTRYMDFIPGTANKIIATGNSTLNILHENFNPVYIGDYDAVNNATYIEVDDSNQVIKFYYNGDSYTFPPVSGGVGQVLGTAYPGTLAWVNSVQSLNGSTGPVGISAGTGISITQSGTTYTIASTGGGGSKTYERFTPLDNQPPTTNFATIDTRNGIAVLDFADSTADESAIFVGVIPEAASLGSGLKVRIIWMATSATSGSVRWGAQFMNLNTDLDSDSFDTATEGNGTANGTSGTPTTTELTVTNIDSLTAGDFFRLKIYREQSDTVNDTMTGDAELIAVEVRSAS